MTATARVLGALLLVAAALGIAAPAARATDYRYWSSWKSAAGTPWTYATVGPSARPADGSVEGWRFGVGTVSSAPAPRTAPDFAAICSTAPAAPAGSKRVAVVVDHGVRADAPQGEVPPATTVRRCVTLPASATGYDALRAVAPIRTNTSGLVCGISGYPRSECGATVTAPPPAPAPAPTPSPPPTPDAKPPAPTPAPAPPSAPDAPAAAAPPPDAQAPDVQAPDAPAPPLPVADPVADPGGTAETADAAEADLATADPATTAAAAQPEAAGPPVLLLVALATTAGLATIAVLRSRRRRAG